MMMLMLVVNRLDVDAELLKEQPAFVISSIFLSWPYAEVKEDAFSTKTTETCSLVITALSLLLSDKQEGRLLAQS